MHDSGGDVHMLPSYGKYMNSLVDSKPGVSIDISDISDISYISNTSDTSVKSNPLREVMSSVMESPSEPEAHIAAQSDYVRFVKNVSFSKCSRCGKYAIWVRDKLVYPVIE